MFGHMGHCVVSIFVTIRQPVYKHPEKSIPNKRGKCAIKIPLAISSSFESKPRAPIFLGHSLNIPSEHQGIFGMYMEGIRMNLKDGTWLECS